MSFIHPDRVRAIEMSDQIKAKRKPGRPPAGRNGSETRTYPQVRVEPGLLAEVKVLAREKGLSLGQMVERLLRAGV